VKKGDDDFGVSLVILFLWVCPHPPTSPQIGSYALLSCDLWRTKHMKEGEATKMVVFPI